MCSERASALWVGASSWYQPVLHLCAFAGCCCWCAALSCSYLLLYLLCSLPTCLAVLNSVLYALHGAVLFWAHWPLVCCALSFTCDRPCWLVTAVACHRGTYKPIHLFVHAQSELVDDICYTGCTHVDPSK
jgi:hypothetical protein